MSGESLVEEFEDLFLLFLIGVSTDSAIKCLKITWPRRTAYPRCYVLLCLAHDNFLSYQSIRINKEHPKSEIFTEVQFSDRAEALRNKTKKTKTILPLLTLKSFCLRDRGRLGNEVRPILLKIGTQSCYVDLCNMPKFQLQ